ncbi:hypothetical protein BV22DRAFT_1046380 [Leucogyrophana mollusca]|uniref:Uncharacterized protein n=1 Tax=Leucogyrophana mollusca TaxID=85980 RepID=A0ACB8BKZ1_9AGAM|nr:hypothetical protein BV22DRAFT_1046380 [Leucogyrophana mollusca]
MSECTRISKWFALEEEQVEFLFLRRQWSGRRLEMPRNPSPSGTNLSPNDRRAARPNERIAGIALSLTYVHGVGWDEHEETPELDVSEADIARIFPRVVSHRLRVHESPMDEVLNSAKEKRGAQDGEGTDDEELWERDIIKDILVKILSGIQTAIISDLRAAWFLFAFSRNDERSAIVSGWAFSAACNRPKHWYCRPGNPKATILPPGYPPKHHTLILRRRNVGKKTQQIDVGDTEQSKIPKGIAKRQSL